MARVSPLVLIPPVVFAGLAGLFAAGMLRDGGEELPSALIGQPAPASELGLLPGYPAFEPSGVLADGEVKLVNFFASWCAPCRLEHPILAHLSAEGIPVYGIAYKDEPARTDAFLDELGNPFTAIGTDSGRIAPDWGLYGVPETFVIAGDGTVVDRLPFPLTPELVESRLRPSLARAAQQE
jgi:cytochrome c biogenesis protein CcmG/thiol:disulfide interchange protein DsbE